jgi:hypothetical protein
MNCQPRDLAIVVRNVMGVGCTEHFIGRPVTVEHMVLTPLGPGWLCSGFPMSCPQCGFGVFGFLDADLQPLRGERKGDTTDRGVDVSRDEPVAA